jgi:alkanesulfonate monooxygenase SsuD/methylene tetrahydromethanopterin reductase-like flavin-dependent oxidoreductase (luciferase family)
VTALGVRVFYEGVSATEVLRLTLAAEGLGYESAWFPEGRGRDVLMQIGAQLTNTRRIVLGTGILPVFSHLPTVVAGAVGTAASLAPGRVILGLGASHKSIMEQTHGTEYSKPLTHVREFTTIVRDLLDGATVTFTGDCYTISRAALAWAPSKHVPIYLAALRPRMLRLAGAIADGVLLNWIPVNRVAAAVAEVRRGAEEAGRQPGDVRIACYIRVCPTLEPEVAKVAAAKELARYVSAENYKQYFAQLGFSQQTEWPTKDEDKIEWRTQSVPLHMAGALVVHGNPAECRAGIQNYRDNGVDLPIIAPISIGIPSYQDFVDVLEKCVKLPI